MHEAIRRMLQNYETDSLDRAVNALREILQEVTLMGLSRAGFFQDAAFYGGTALRIIYGINRYSEDMDFSLLEPSKDFSFDKYGEAIINEIESFGFNINLESCKKRGNNQIASAFLKTNTLTELVTIEAPEDVLKQIPKGRLLKIKLEVDTDPPPLFETEIKFHLAPIPFSMRVYTLSDLFAGKMHAVLCRRWKSRTKGRDWYDLLWYLSKGTKINLIHLEQRMIQTGDWNADYHITKKILIDLLKQAIEFLDIKGAQRDILPFLKDPREIEIWSPEFFKEIVSRIQIQDWGQNKVTRNPS